MERFMDHVHVGDALVQLVVFLFSLLPVVVIVLVLVYVIRLVRRMERRAEERLQFEKENAAHQEQHIEVIHDVQDRLSNIERILKDVD
ncbi:hypothetical protein [Lentibacillus saliphilus]|uniref:hypothetical protein n=1 Tax=Lentibacillus saliphilus TaxID=2737028 RepID=UPI001C2FC9DF|nr:hypothetical protein [Lentibacillus saliphilus]